VNKVSDFEAALHAFLKANYADLLKEINEKADYNDEIAAKMREAVEKFKATSTW